MKLLRLAIARVYAAQHPNSVLRAAIVKSLENAG